MGIVSIPSSGSIQFLHIDLCVSNFGGVGVSQSPQTGQFNSYLKDQMELKLLVIESQSPQTGQFNSY